MLDVIIVGCGTTGAAAAYHLSRCSPAPPRVLCLEMGSIGRGFPQQTRVRDSSVLTKEEESQYSPSHSGSNVFEGGEMGPSTIKMAITLPPYHNLAEFAEHHGWEGVRTYLEVAKYGIDLEVKTASDVLPDPTKQVRRLGSLMLCTQEQLAAMEEEYTLLRELGCECEWWAQQRVWGVQGVAAQFVAGIWFPHDAVIDSVSYARSLLSSAVKTGFVKVEEHCPPVTCVQTVLHDGQRVGQVTLRDGSTRRAKKVIVATGGLYMDDTLAGILTPCYSYLAAVPHKAAPPLTPLRHEGSQSRLAGNDGGAPCAFTGGGMPGGTRGHSMNFFTFGFSHDWCVSDGYVRVSGEDHYSALKPPRHLLRCGRLEQWVYRKYPYLNSAGTPPSPIATSAASAADGVCPRPSAVTASPTAASTGSNQLYKYGVYSATPDHLPLVGSVRDDSCVVYMVGCNAWGQASMSAAASLAPCLLGYRDFTSLERRAFDLFSIRRYTGKQLCKL